MACLMMDDDSDEILLGEVFEIHFERIQADTHRFKELCEWSAKRAQEIAAGVDARRAALEQLDI